MELKKLELGGALVVVGFHDQQLVKIVCTVAFTLAVHVNMSLQSLRAKNSARTSSPVMTPLTTIRKSIKVVSEPI